MRSVPTTAVAVKVKISSGARNGLLLVVAACTSAPSSAEASRATSVSSLTPESVSELVAVVRVALDPVVLFVAVVRGMKLKTCGADEEDVVEVVDRDGVPPLEVEVESPCAGSKGSLRAVLPNGVSILKLPCQSPNMFR